MEALSMSRFTSNDRDWLINRAHDFQECSEKLGEYIGTLKAETDRIKLASFVWLDERDGCYPFRFLGRNFKFGHTFDPEPGNTRLQILELVGAERGLETWDEKSAVTMDKYGNMKSVESDRSDWPWSVHNDGVGLFFNMLKEAVNVE